MKHLFSRLRSLADNIHLLSPLMGGAIPAALYLLRTRGQANAIAQGQYKEIPFIFRRRDISALREVLLNGEYDFAREDVKNAATCCDIGAHIGLFAIWALAQNPHARILSIEASPDTYKILERNAAMARERGLNWTTAHKAAWGAHTQICFSNEAESTMSHRVNTTGSVTVSTITLPDLIEKMGQENRIDLLKIDIEGAEESFICPHESALAHVGKFIMELHPALCDTDAVCKTLTTHFDYRNVCEGENRKPLVYGSHR